MIVLTHAGVDISVNGYDYASVEQVLHVLKEVAPQKLVLAHMGGWATGREKATPSHRRTDDLYIGNIL